MAKPFDFGEINLDVKAGRDRSRVTVDSETPFRILILGDFSGKMGRVRLDPTASLMDRRPQLVDRDNFDDVLRKSCSGIQVPLAEDQSTIWFSDIDDFHPDRLYERTPLFQKLRELRSRLSNPSTFRETAAEIGIPVGGEIGAQDTARPQPANPPDVAAMASRSLLDDAIASTEGQGSSARPTPAPSGLADFLERAVTPHLVASPHPKQSEVISAIDRALAGQMRALLHIPAFQALEAAWRAVFFLVRRIETSAQLKLYLLDVSKQELAQDLSPDRDLRGASLYRLLVEQTVRTPGAEPWTVLAGNYTFNFTQDDLTLLGHLAHLAADAGAPLIAGASPGFLGCDSIMDLPDATTRDSTTEEAKLWEALRSSAEAVHLGLALPRFLLRLPYGKDTIETVSFNFEEMSGKPPHEDYLWGNPAFLCVCLLAEAFAAEGWEMRPGSFQEIGGLPLHIFKEEDGEPEAKPCAEVLMTEDAAERILASGLMPIVSLKDRDAVRLLRFQSISKPLRELSARWG